MGHKKARMARALVSNRACRRGWLFLSRLLREDALEYVEKGNRQDGTGR